MIWLLRHGDAADGSPDAERPLTDTGRSQAQQAGQALAVLGVEVDACLTSPRVRAADTARIACEALDGVIPEVEEALSGGPIDPRELSTGRGDEVLLVGHDPDLSTAVHDMTGAQVRLPKGALAGIEKGELKVLLRPAELGAIARAAPAGE